MNNPPLFIRDSGVVAALTICFVVLKLVGFVDWSWWWVLAPVWVVGATVVAVIVLTVLLKRWFDGDWEGDSHRQ